MRLKQITLYFPLARQADVAVFQHSVIFTNLKSFSAHEEATSPNLLYRRILDILTGNSLTGMIRDRSSQRFDFS